MSRLFTALALAAALGGCASVPTPRDPQQAVFALGSAYVAALKLESAYATLPGCSPSSGPVCQDRATFYRLVNYDVAAYASYKAAEAVVRAHQDSGAAIAAATAAITAFSALALSLKVK